MSTAILISGQLRTFAKCWPTQRWHVLRHFEDPHFFVTIQDAPCIEKELVDPLVAEYGEGRVFLEIKNDPDLSTQLTPALARAYHQAPYANAAPAHQLLLQHWYQNECWKFFQSELTRMGSFPPINDGPHFDTIIRMRGDNFFHSFVCPAKWDGLLFNTVHTPWWGRFAGLNDRFAIMGEEAAGAYFTLYENIPTLLAAGCPFHPETLLKAQLERHHVRIREDLKAEFSTLRANGEQRWPEITPIDIVHAALRAA